MIRINHIGLGHQHPAVFIGHSDVAAAGQGLFNAQDRQKRRFEFRSCARLCHAPVHQHPVIAFVFKDRLDFLRWDDLIRVTLTKGDPEKPHPRAGVMHPVRDQLKLGLSAARHFKKLNPIGNRTDRVDKIMTDARSDQIGVVCVRHLKTT